VTQGGLDMTGTDLDDILDDLDFYITLVAENDEQQEKLQNELDDYKCFVVQPGHKSLGSFAKKGICPRTWWQLQGHNKYPNLYQISA
jgi:hypothetical protein